MKKEECEGGLRIKRSEMNRETKGCPFIDDRSTFLRFICHGDPERSLWFRGRPLPLCSRCLLLWSAVLLLGPISFLFFFINGVQTDIIFLISGCLLMPLIVDGITQYMGWRRSDNIIRAITGLLAGTGVAIGLGYILSRLL